MKKVSQQSRSRWWIWSRDTAKGHLMCYLLLHQKVRRKTIHESQFLLSSRTEQHHRTGRPFGDAYSSSYSEWDVDKTWSSQEWKSVQLMEDRTGRSVVFAQYKNRFIIENDKMNSYFEAESEMSLKSRSFLHKRNDQVRKRQNQSSKDATQVRKRKNQSSKDATKNSVKHFSIWRMFMSSTSQVSVFMRKNYSDNLHSIKKYRRSRNETHVRHIWKIDNRSIRRGLWNEYS